MAQKLDEQDIEENLDDMQIWSFYGDKLTTRVEFDDYRDAVFFANSVFSIAEEEFHHPEVKVEYGGVEIDLWSHEEEGVTEQDIEMAKRIEQKVGNIGWK
jgi:4a-hydroxytetrahydrobiopterin dehydratase